MRAGDSGVHSRGDVFGGRHADYSRGRGFDGMIEELSCFLEARGGGGEGRAVAKERMGRCGIS